MSEFKIKCRYSNEVLFSHECCSMLECVVEANKKGADLRGADLRGADLEGAYLRGADLRGADLRGADLRGADLEGAYLRGADLEGAYLRGADLEGAYLRGADLEGAYLRGAYLRGSDFSGSDLEGAKRNNKTIKHFSSWINMYKYVVEAQVCEDNSVIIRLGCHTRTLEEWESDFWNNDSEFPNDGSEGSELRLNAYNFAKNWAKIKAASK